MLAKILTHKREEIAASKRALPLAELRRRVADVAPARDFAAALRRRNVAVIAEIKRASPSRGPLALDLDPATLARSYELGGAAALSVLTDGRFFSGSLEDLARARAAVSLPALRKDFVVDEYQVWEARAAGADALLLIVAALGDDQLGQLLGLAGEVGLACLVEAHDEGEVGRALAHGARLLGINNRDLRTFAVDLATTERLAALVPADRTVVAESGIHGRADVARLAGAGVDAVLVGESLVTAPEASARLRELAGVARRERRQVSAAR
ncbi:MAG: indole-3-glycerol phosphate synthase TrpC [Chloroflexota bacterium]